MSEYTPTTEEVVRKFATGATWQHQSYAAGEAEIRRWLDAHDAEVRAVVVAEEPEWEYLIRRPNGSEFVSSYSEAGPGSRVVSKRQKCPWEPLEN